MTTLVDVVIPVYADVAGTRRCIESVLANADGIDRVIVVDDCGPDADMRPMLRDLRERFPTIHLLENEKNLGFVGACNRGLALRRGDVVVLNSDTIVTAGWLSEMVGVLRSDVRIAAVCPLSNNAASCSVPEYMTGSPLDESATFDFSSSPRWTALPTGVGFCMLMKGAVLDLLGPFDPIYGRGYNEENDWCQRARERGFVIARANRAFVHHTGQVSFGTERNARDEHNAHVLVARYPNYLKVNAHHRSTPEARVAASSARVRPRVLVEVADESLFVAPSDEFDVTVRRTVGSLDDFELVHRVGVPESQADVLRLLRAPGHLVVSWGDVALFADDASRSDWEAVRAARMWQRACVDAAQHVFVPSSFAGSWLNRAATVVRPDVSPLPTAQRGLSIVHWAHDGDREFEALVVDAFVASALAEQGAELVLTSPGGDSLPPKVRRERDATSCVPRAALVLCLDVADVSGARARAANSCGVPVLAPSLGVWPEVVAAPLERLTVEALVAALRTHVARRVSATARREPSATTVLSASYREVLRGPLQETLHRRALLAELIAS